MQTVMFSDSSGLNWKLNQVKLLLIVTLGTIDGGEFGQLYNLRDFCVQLLK